jgi:hypothetical protein
MTEIRLPCGCVPGTPQKQHSRCDIARVDHSPNPTDGQLAAKAMFEELNALWRLRFGVRA